MRVLKILLILWCPLLYGQQLQFENLGAKIALPSQECYKITQDRKGYIWFSTEQGLCVYDGTRLTVYDKSNGLPEGAVYAMTEDHRGKMWFATSKNRILFFENGKLKESEFSKAMKPRLNEFDITYALHFDGRGKLHINMINRTLIADVQASQVKEVPAKFSTDFHFLTNGNQFIPIAAWHWANLKMLQKVQDQPIRIQVQRDGKTQTVEIPRGGLRLPNPQSVCSNSRSYGAFSIHDRLVKYQQGKYSLLKMPQRILSIQVDKDGGLWVGLLKDGLHYYPDGDWSKPPIISLKGYSVTGILEDAEKSIWCTTLEKGLFFCKNKSVVNYFNIPELARPADMLKSIGNKVYISRSTKMFALANGTLKQYSIGHYSKESVLDMVSFQNDLYLGGHELVARTNAVFNPLRIVPMKDGGITGVKQLLAHNGVLCLSFPSAIARIRHGKIEPLIHIPSRTRCFQALDDERFLVGSDDGLYDVSVKDSVVVKVAGINFPVTQILPFGKTFWITTKGGGLYRYDNAKIVSANQKLKIPTLILFDAARYKNGFWLASNKGLIQLSRQKDGYSASVFGMKQGLPANEIYKLAVSGNQMFLSTLEGVCSFLPDQALRNMTRPNIYLNRILVNGKPTNDNKLKLAYDHNTLRLFFDLTSYKAPPELLFKLKGRDDHFRKQAGNQILLENLSPGHYELVVYGVNSDGVASKSPVTVPIEIEKPFWEKIWFLGLCGLLLVLGLLLAVRKIIQKVKSAESEKTRINKLIADSQLSALQAQMNPHFIFNAINSIQNYILKKQETEAYTYLAKFSKLIRLVLHHSQQQMLPLAEELETIKLYIELEQLRFDSFDFELTIAENISEYEVMVPAMIMQPYLENAIWHGLMHLDGKRRGKLQLAFETENALLKISIADNGIGRKLSAEYRKDHMHKPIAMQLTAQRIEILNQQYANEKIKVTVEDIYQADGIPAGTRVILYLPISQFDQDEKN